MMPSGSKPVPVSGPTVAYTIVPPGWTSLFGVVVVALWTLPMPPVGAFVTVLVTVVAVVFFAPDGVVALAVVAVPLAAAVVGVLATVDAVMASVTVEVAVDDVDSPTVVGSWTLLAFLFPPP